MGIATCADGLSLVLRDTLIGKLAELKVATRARNFAVDIWFRYISVLNRAGVYVKFCCGGKLDEGPLLAALLSHPTLVVVLRGR